MTSLINIAVHQSQFPERVQEALLAGLRTRRIAPKFHYQSYKQAQLWLAVNRAFSPNWTDPECDLVYERSLQAAAASISERRVHVIGLGCGEGNKEARLLVMLASQGKDLSFMPCDASLPLLLTAAAKAQGPISVNLENELGIPTTSNSLAPQSGSRYRTAYNLFRSQERVRERGTPEKPLSPALSPQAGRESEPDSIVKLTPMAQVPCPAPACRPLLCDLALADNLPDILSASAEAEARRVVTFFGMMPNLEPDDILPKLAALLGAEDLLLLSANLAPGPDYRAGVQRVLPGYDNPPTRAWLRAFLEDVGAEPEDGVVDFSIEEVSGLLRMAGDFRFMRERELTVYGERFVFRSGEVVRLFFSYRHTPELVRQLLQGHGLRVVDSWVTTSQEEGVFLCRKAG